MICLRQSGDISDTQEPWLSTPHPFLQDSASLFLESRLARSSLPTKLVGLFEIKSVFGSGGGCRKSDVLVVSGFVF